MKRYFSTLLLSVALLSGGACSSGGSRDNNNGVELPGALDPVKVIKSNSMQVYAHYMPWFETPETNSGSWGEHWTMDSCDPNQKESDGKRQIASHYYPLIGPYASSNATVLNYHALLMKYSGIDGVMIDWYGLQDKYDYPSNKKNTEALVAALDRVGLNFSIVYEDATLNGLADKVAQATRDMKYLQNNFFSKTNYVKYNNAPLLMVFGPQQLNTAAEWNTVFSNLTSRPAFTTLFHQSYKANDTTCKNAIGEYVWVDPTPLVYYKNEGKNHELCMGGAMPGFNDYYQEGNWGNGYTTYDHENGALFDRQLQAAKDAGLEYLQISTWNDFGEGTTIEPTREYGYKYLTKLQQFTGTVYQQSHLELVHRWYELKLKYTGAETDASKYLTQAFYYLIALQPEKAEAVIKNL